MFISVINIIVNGQPRQVADETSVAGLLEEMQIERRGVAVELNLDVVPRGEHQTRLLREGDQVEIVTFVGGG